MPCLSASFPASWDRSMDHGFGAPGVRSWVMKAEHCPNTRPEDVD